MSNNRIKKILVAVLLLALFVCLSACSKQEGEGETINYIVTEESFKQSLQNGEKTVYVGDISFSAQTEITLNYPIEIIGKTEKSTIENVGFKILGTNVPSENTVVTFKNLILDGKVDKSAISFEEGKTFDEIIGDIPQSHAINGSVGYSTINIDNCEIRNYLHEDGPAIYIKNDVNYREGKKVLNLTRSRIYNNIAYAGTVKVFSDILTTNIDECDFYGNTARAGQGIWVGNGRSDITDTIIHDNDFFHFVYAMERKLPSIFHDDKQTYKGLTTNALGGCCGALFIGGSHTTVDRCKIYNNKTVYGGGIGIFNAETLEQDEKVEIKNTEIKNNTALRCGGGIYLESNQGETTYFTNCNIIGNRAEEEGSVIYITTYHPDKDTAYGGNVQFAFCTMSDNTAADADTFTFYELLKPELAGKVSLKGCFILDNSPYVSGENEYNYVATKEQALLNNVISSTDSTKPLSNSLGDIIVPCDVYKTWTTDFSESTGNRQIGYSVFLPTEDNRFPYWTLVFPAVAVVGVAVFLIFYFQKKKQLKAETITATVDETALTETAQAIDYSRYSFLDIEKEVTKLYGEILTKKEITVTTYLLYGKTRKEIAQELFVSEDTVKTHLSHIFKKTGVSSKIDLKKIIEEQLFAGV